MDMRQKYDKAIQAAKGLRMQGSADERNGKLYFTGTVNSDWQTDIIADIRVSASAAPPQAAAATASAAQTYTVKPGDSLSKIAKEQLGNGNLYMEIFNANKDVLTDPDKLKPGMVLKLPVAAT
jgi:nucleoid-associated protein YgaU